MNTQFEEAKKQHHEFMALPAVEKQRMKWRNHEWDPKLKQQAAEVIAALGGAKFNIETLQGKHQIYAGYFHQPALTNGYMPIIKGDKHTGEYTLRKDEKSHETHTLEKIIKNQDWLLAQMADEATEKDKKIEALESQNKSLKKQLATLKKTSLKDMPNAGKKP